MKKQIALIAHNGCKPQLLKWALRNKAILAAHDLFATGTTGKKLEQQINLKITKFSSGPLGGDQQIGSRITEGKINILIFFWDPLGTRPHDDDTKALLRVATLWNIPIACNESSADYLLSSPLMHKLVASNDCLSTLNYANNF